MSTDYSYQNFSSFDPNLSINKPSLTYDTESHLLIFKQGSTEKQFEVQMMGKDLKNFALTPQQKELLGNKIAELISKKLDLKKGVSLDTLTITNQGIKIHQLDSRTIDITFTPGELKALSDIFPNKIPVATSQSLPINPNRVVAGPEKQSRTVTAFLKNAFEAISIAFSGLVGFFLPPKEAVDLDNINIGFVDVTKKIDTSDRAEIEKEFTNMYDLDNTLDQKGKTIDRQDKTLDELIEEQNEMTSSPNTDPDLTDPKKPKMEFDPDSIIEKFIDKNKDKDIK